MTNQSPEEIALDSLKGALETEYAAEGFPVEDDYLHGSLGRQGTVIGISPERARPEARNAATQESEFLVQFYGKYDLKVDPLQKVSSKPIMQMAQRFREAMKVSDPHQPSVWYFMVTDIKYPTDPTGNKTRFEATVVARGANYALRETS